MLFFLLIYICLGNFNIMKNIITILFLSLSITQDYQFSDFVGNWTGNITNNQTWAFDYPIEIEISFNNEYQVTYNPGSQLISDLYPGTEQVYYNTTSNILSFQWVQYYHYACGGACYTSVPFEVVDFNNGQLTLYYNNGSGSAPQAYSMFLTLDDQCEEGEIDNDNPCNPMQCLGGEWAEIIIDCPEQEGIPCLDGIYLDPEAGDCCSICTLLGDLNNDFSVNVLDAIEAVNLVLYGDYNPIVDMNFDGVVNILDIIEIIYIILN